MEGLKRGMVYLCPWTPKWKEEFENEAELIRKLIGGFILDIHHIGSTSVEGLAAKPIIDIAITLEKFDDGLKCIDSLESIGYSYKGVNVLPERYYFNKGNPRTHQIHMYEKKCQYFKEHLIFRDILIKNKEIREAYKKIKYKLADENKTNKIEYTKAKTDFILGVLSNSKK